MDSTFVVTAVGGVRMLADPPTHSGRELASSGLWEWNVGALIVDSLEQGDVFVDVGANAGYYTALAARIVGPSGHVYALEPAPRTFEKLLRNLRLNGLDNVSALPVAAGAVDGHAMLYGPAEGHDATSSLTRRWDEGVETSVEVHPLPPLLEPHHRERVKLIKVDVEGHEDNVLRGLEPLLRERRVARLIVEVHASYNPDAPAYVAEVCDRHGLRVRWIVEDRVNDRDLAPVDRELELEDLGSRADLRSIPRPRYALVLDADDSFSGTSRAGRPD